MVVERDHHGFDAPAPLGHPARADMPADHPQGHKLAGDCRTLPYRTL